MRTGMSHLEQSPPAPPVAAVVGATDEQLLLRYRNEGDRRAFEDLVHRYEHELFSYLRRYLGDPGLAEDVFQAAFLQVHLKCGAFEAHRKFRPWLYTIATHQAIDAQRRNKRHRMVSLDRENSRAAEGDEVGTLLGLLEGTEPGPHAKIEAGERRAWVRRAVGQLPDSLRGAVTLIYYQGMKYREAAEVLAVPVGTVKSRLHAALTKLNEAWIHAHPPHDED